MIARKSTACTMLVGPILDSTGAAVTTEVVASLRITKNGTVSSLNASATLTHSHSGMYLLALTASDADTAGWCQISLTSGTNAMNPVNFHVVESAAICAAAAEAIRQYEAGETLEWPDEHEAEKLQAAINDIEAGRVRPMADVIAQLAPIDGTWRKTWTECADLLKSVAEKDPAAAAGYVARCREWLTRAVQYGS